MQEAEQGADGGRLAGAVRAQEAEDLAGLDLEVQVDEGLDVAVVLAQALGGDRRLACPSEVASMLPKSTPPPARRPSDRARPRRRPRWRVAGRSGTSSSHRLRQTCGAGARATVATAMADASSAGIPVDAHADRRQRQVRATELAGQLQAGPIRPGQQLRLAVRPAPDRANGVDHPARRQRVRRSQAVPGAAVGIALAARRAARAAAAWDRAVRRHLREPRIGRVADGVDASRVMSPSTSSSRPRPTTSATGSRRARGQRSTRTARNMDRRLGRWP